MPASCSGIDASTHAQQVYGGIGEQVRDSMSGGIAMHPVGGTFAAPQSGGQRRRRLEKSRKGGKKWGGSRRRSSGKKGRSRRAKSCSLWGGNYKAPAEGPKMLGGNCGCAADADTPVLKV